MSYEKKPDRSQTFLLPPSLDDWLPKDHPARFIDAFLESSDLEAMGFEVGDPPDGRPRFSARLLLAVYLYCYFDRIRSTRRMERACLENVALMWLTGNEHPDHNTLWRFFVKNKEAIRGVLKKSARVAVKSGLVGMVLHAVDGTKIRAQASCKSAQFRKALEGALQRVDQSIDALEATLGEAESSGVDTYRLPEELADAHKRKEAIQRSLDELKAVGVNSLNPHEPDARVMKCNGRKEFGYNAQAVTDSKAGIVVAEEVVADETDHGLLTRMIEKVEETVDSVAETTLADKGYAAGEDLHEAAEKGFNVLVNLPRNVAPAEDKKPFHTSRFIYDSERNCWICPLGGTLSFERFKDERRGHCKLSVYHCDGYKECPRRWECSRNKRGRTIEIGEHHLAVEKQRDKLKDETLRAALALRGCIVEPSFAQAKENLGFRRWSYRYLAAVRAQWSLICTTINLRKLYGAWLKGQVVLA